MEETKFARGKKTRWILFLLALLCLSSPVLSSQAYTVIDDTQHIYQLDTIPIREKSSGGDTEIDSDLPGINTPEVASPTRSNDLSTIEWIMKKLVGPDFKWEHNSFYTNLKFFTYIVFLPN